jgi:hypothetical protein
MSFFLPKDFFSCSRQVLLPSVSCASFRPKRFVMLHAVETKFELASQQIADFNS